MRVRLPQARLSATSYWACAAIHVLAVACDAKLLRWFTKAALMPTLATWVRARNGPPLLLAAVLASGIGDVLMERRLLLPAMVVYAAAHACYVAVFLTGQRRRQWQVIAAYGVLWAGLMALLWPGLGAYRAPVAAYALMLTATAVTSLWYGGRSGLGGALFLISDTLIGARLAGHDFPLRGPLVMATYGAGQFHLAAGVVHGIAGTPERGSDAHTPAWVRGPAGVRRSTGQAGVEPS
jgi:uncharacterized membrane protein YhhN